MAIKPRHYLVIDLEATCWQTPAEAQGPNEIIEIGVAILSPSKERIWNGGWFVRPMLCPELSEFCTTLTSIKQQDVDTAVSFPIAMQELEQQVLDTTGAPANDALFVSWGNYDRNQFEKDCLLHHYKYPFGEHLNLKQTFIDKYKLKRAGMAAALRYLKLPLLGTHHRGTDDALNISRILEKFEEL